MKTFAYTAFTADGKRRRGVVVAEDETDASAKISAQGLLPSEISPQSAARPTRSRARRIDHDMLSVFTRQMAVLLSAGMAADAALEAVQTAAGANRIERLAAEARAGLMEGEPLSQALERAGGALPAWFTAAIRAGEHSGDLDAVFLTLADHLESTASDRAAITSALIYPAFVAGVAVIVCAVLMVTVAPEIVAMFAATGQELPPLTLAVLGVVDFIQAYWPWLAGLLAALVALGVASGRVPALKKRRDRLVLRLPLAGRFLRMNEAASYLRTLALVINSRLPLTEALRFAADVLGTEGFTLEARAAGEALQHEIMLRAQPIGDFAHEFDQVATAQCRRVAGLPERMGGVDAHFVFCSPRRIHSRPRVPGWAPKVRYASTYMKHARRNGQANTLAGRYRNTGKPPQPALRPDCDPLLSGANQLTS